MPKYVLKSSLYENFSLKICAKRSRTVIIKGDFGARDQARCFFDIRDRSGNGTAVRLTQKARQLKCKKKTNLESDLLKEGE